MHMRIRGNGASDYELAIERHRKNIWCGSTRWAMCEKRSIMRRNGRDGREAGARMSRRRRVSVSRRKRHTDGENVFTNLQLPINAEL